MPRAPRVGPLSCVVMIAMASCGPCEELEAKLCHDLGAEDCALWRQPPVGKAGIGSDTMTSESCANTQSGPVYDRMLSAARAAVEDRKRTLEREKPPP